MTTSAEPSRWVAQRAAGSALTLSDDDRDQVVATAHGLLPFLDSWEAELRDSQALPFPITGRLRQHAIDSSPQAASRATPRDDVSDPYHTLLAAIDDGDNDGDARAVTLTVKANIDVAGITTSCGAAPHNPAVPATPAERSSPIVERLIGSGARLVGIANLGELALDATSDNPWHGRVDNPAAPGHCAGGSSGGSAASIAAGLARVSIGSDSGGSVRIPAAFCGVFGYRPTPGRTPLAGLRGAAWSIDTIGIMADSTSTLRWAAESSLAVTASPAPERPRLGVLVDQGLGPTQPAVEERYRACIESASCFADIVQVDLSGLVDAPAVAAIIAYAEAAAQLVSGAKQAPDSFGRPARQLVQFGSLLSAQDYLLAQRMRSILWDRWTNATDGLDGVLTPTVPMLPFEHGTTAQIPGDESELAIFAIIRFTALANVLALPAVAMPAGRAAGLPVGLQLIGPHDTDDRLLSIAQQVAELAGAL